MILELNLGVFIAVVAILGSLWLFGRFLLGNEIAYTPAKKRHNWKSINMLGSGCYCSVCEMMLSPSNGKFCVCCNVCADPSCIKRADQLLKCKEKASNSDRTTHLWVKGNLPQNCICFVCNEDVDYHAEPGLYGYRCCWCQRTAHNHCFPKEPLFYDEHCDFGEYKNMILPPTQLMVTKLRGTTRKLRSFMGSVQPPPDLDNWKPLFVIANSKSGDSNSAEVISMFRGLLHPLQVMEMNSGGPKEALRWVKKLCPNHCRILVAGGDGTVGWILNTIFEMRINPIPEVCILPIGTGNDLSRVLGWGSETNSFNPIDIMEKIQHSESIKLDRWLMDIVNAPSRIPLNWNAYRLRFMYNYFSVGVDAQVALNFHKARQSPLYVSSSRLINKALYLCFGTQQVMQPDCVGLENQVDLYLDGMHVELPELQSIVCLNIDSWGAGVRLWEMSMDNEEINTQSTSDGVLEVLGIVSSFHIAQLQVGLNKPIRLGQAKSVKMIMRQSYPIQVDGEPWMQPPGEINITLNGQAKMLKCVTE